MLNIIWLLTWVGLVVLQGGKQEWHIATGVPFKSKKLSADEMSAMVDRLCTPKHEADNLPPKPHVRSTRQCLLLSLAL